MNKNEFLRTEMRDALPSLTEIRNLWPAAQRTRIGWVVMTEQPVWHEGEVVASISGRVPVVLLSLDASDNFDLAVAAHRSGGGYALTPGCWAVLA